MPLGDYSDFADCVAKNRGKVSDPEAYCGSIKHKVEGEEVNVINEVLMSLGEIGEDGVLRGAQLMPIGEWRHPLGNIRVTPERARRFAEQFKRNVAGQQLPVYFIHSDSKNVPNPYYGKAAGWFLDVKADDDKGVLVDIQFTDAGKEAVKKKEYAYLSAEYFDKVQLPHHSSPQDDVIVGAALVNRPHLKGMNPILNEETGHQFLLGAADQPIKGGNPMDPILRQLCEQAQISLTDDQTELTEEQRTKLTEFLAGRQKEFVDATSKVQQLEQQLKDQDPEGTRVKSLEEAGYKEEARLLSEYRADRMVKQLSEFVPEGHKISATGEQVIRAYALEQSPENLMSLHEAILSGKALVDMRELGISGGGENEGDEGASEQLASQFIAGAEKLASDKQISFGEAMSEYARTHVNEWNAYQDSIGGPRAAKMGG